jgi:hypothetical protein
VNVDLTTSYSQSTDDLYDYYAIDYHENRTLLQAALHNLFSKYSQPIFHRSQWTALEQHQQNRSPSSSTKSADLGDEGESLHAKNCFALRYSFKILTMNRPHSLLRLLLSLRDADYSAVKHENISLEIFVDYGRNTEVM